MAAEIASVSRSVRVPLNCRPNFLRLQIVSDLPRPVKALRDRCFGITTTPARLTQVRNERRPNSGYASLEQCSYELRRAEAMYRSHRIPTINSSAKSVEEMSTVILQSLKHHSASSTTEH